MADKERFEEKKKGKIVVRICGRDKGLEIYEGVKFVRIVCKQYNLLIMEDYLPVIGEIDGLVFFRDDEREYKRENIKGFFMHKKNQFSLMLDSEGGRAPKEGKNKKRRRGKL